MTLLEAINTCLTALGEARVTSSEVRHPTVDLIKSTLVVRQRLLLERGYWFNVTMVTMFPAPDGTMEYPSNALSIVGPNGNVFIPRGGLLFDVINNTDRFTSSQDLKVTYNLNFEDLPECVAVMLTCDTAMEIYTGDFGVDTTVQKLNADRANASAQCEMLHLRNVRHSTRERRGFRRIRNALKNA